MSPPTPIVSSSTVTIETIIRYIFRYALPAIEAELAVRRNSTFHHFAELPVEVRCMIWARLVLNGTQWAHMIFNSPGKTIPMRVLNYEDLVNEDTTGVPDQWAPVPEYIYALPNTFGTSWENLQAAMLNWPGRSRNTILQCKDVGYAVLGPILVDLDIDTFEMSLDELYYTTDEEWTYNSLEAPFGNFRTLCSRIKHLRLEVDTSGVPEAMAEKLHAFVGLDTLVLGPTNSKVFRDNRGGIAMMVIILLSWLRREGHSVPSVTYTHWTIDLRLM